tara:strand:- start:7540 stop:7824 length:285 start_codon:yes stop_codon:yes gene_type:complete
MKRRFSELTEEAIKNIRSDREQTKELLQDIVKYLAGAEERHKEVGLTVAKYLETLQRSNEQLVKIASLQQKTEGGDTSLSEQERAEIFEELNKE